MDESQWHRTFLLFPEKVEGKWRWLRFVEARKVYDPYDYEAYWELRLPLDPLDRPQSAESQHAEK